MDITEIRRHNTRLLEKKLGGRANLSEKTEIDYAQYTAYIGSNPSRNMGEKMARKIEEHLKLPHGWLDQEHEINAKNNTIGVNRAFTLPILSVESLATFTKNEAAMIVNDPLQIEQLEKIGTNPEYAMWFQIKDNTMESSLKEGCFVIVDLEKKNVKSGEVYAIKTSDEILVRRIYKEASGYKIACDNPLAKLKNPDITKENFEEGEVVGKVVWQSGAY